ncbi:MAG: hypothetical protein H7Y02_09550 [Candidatus Obscuribacterales bacterium]|nr:hypothetical protein [Steroidobacteraceae bacterium]
MRWEKIADSWLEFAPLAKRHWVELGGERLTIVDGQRELLADGLQECYGLPRDAAQREIDDWIATFADSDDEDDANSFGDSATTTLHRASPERDSRMAMRR